MNIHEYIVSEPVYVYHTTYLNVAHITNESCKDE